MHLRLSSLLAALVLALSSVVLLSPPPASADSCYTWSSTLRSGSKGAAVTQLQIRVAGWAGYGVNMAVDGSYGPQTTQAVKNFQAAYGLTADGVAGPKTFAKIYALQDADCSPAHFSWAEVDGGCGAGGYSGGSVSAATVKANLLRAMWKAEAMRHRMGDKPIRVTSGFRSKACDRQVGGSGSGQHTYGRAIDMVPINGNNTFCNMAKNARYIGYGAIFGPGYPGHNDHVHVDIRSGRKWSAPTCGI